MGSEFLRVKGILDQIRETEEETRMIAEVSRIKAILDNGGYNSAGFLCDMLSKLKQMVVSLKVLEVSMIGKSVSSLMNHTCKDVRHTARMLVVSWRRMVDEWIAVNDHMLVVQEEECGGSNKNPLIEKPVLPRKCNNITCEKPKEKMVIGAHKLQVRKTAPKSQHKKRLTMVVLEKECKKKPLTVVEPQKQKISVETMKSQKPTKSIVPLMSLDKKSVEEKLEATKRKLQEGYKEAQNTKRQRRIQVIQVHDVLRIGLAPKFQDSRFGKRISRFGGLVH